MIRYVIHASQHQSRRVAMVQVVESSELNEVGSYQFVVGCEPTLRDYEPLNLTLSRTRDRGLICASRGLRAGFPLRENDERPGQA